MFSRFSKKHSIILMLVISSFSFANNGHFKSNDSTKVLVDSLRPGWKEFNRASLDISEVAFVNWNAGGSNSISGLFGLESGRSYKKGHMVWENRVAARIGLNKQQEQSLRKTDDILELNSRFGFRKDTISNWYYSANFSFKTQFANGYNYANSDSEPISRFMAPAYLFLGVGTVYGEHIEEFSAYMSPLTLKSTFVLDQNLANAGSFGVTPAEYDDEGNLLSEGRKYRREFGILLTSGYESEVMENISVRNELSLYTDYLNDFGNFDVDWQVNLKFIVNDFVKASLGSHLKYDNDIKIINENMETEEDEVSGAKVQWKQLLGLGVSIDF
jgi:hypothetical protein